MESLHRCFVHSLLRSSDDEMLDFRFRSMLSLRDGGYHCMKGSRTVSLQLLAGFGPRVGSTKDWFVLFIRGNWVLFFPLLSKRLFEEPVEVAPSVALGARKKNG